MCKYPSEDHGVEVLRWRGGGDDDSSYHTYIIIPPGNINVYINVKCLLQMKINKVN